ncbi:hypothetical protein [Streptomyces sp. NBC_00503]|uniref:hypothetical protein n=1 Tax=Streptomyces sp. NBC_00503 TaxID=2903659 RepID=UPI002E8247AA|nr:hypothetical protein [Streptomyces sp. NBC_00503]WUD79177.1 hypothetical protein OG490_00455 [Streptomyces sp. NBC_00503]
MRRLICYISAALDRPIARAGAHATHDPDLKAGPTSPYAYLTQYVASRTPISSDPAVTVVQDPVGGRAFDTGFPLTHFAKALS